MGERVNVVVDGKGLSLSNLTKVLYPQNIDSQQGFTKGAVIDYHRQIAPYMLPHLHGRCVTLRRWPDGVQGKSFFEKRCPSHRPNWVKVGLGPGDSNRDNRKSGIYYCQLNDAPSLIWAANLAALEIHAPMAVGKDIHSPTAVVFDLDPGEPAGLVECCQVAMEIKTVLESIGLTSSAKTSGSKGLQVYVPLNLPHAHKQAANFALAVGQLIAKTHPQLALVDMSKAKRVGKVFIDWSQNSFHKTTIAPYSLRGLNLITALGEPPVSTPISWEEVSDGCGGNLRQFSSGEILKRVADFGDLFAGCLTLKQTLPTFGSRQ